MKKQTIYVQVVSILILLLFPQNVNCTENNPAKFIKQFYCWYIDAGKDIKDALKSEKANEYISKDILMMLQDRSKVLKLYTGWPVDDNDYFLKMLDPPLSMNGINIEVKSTTSIGEGTHISHVKIISSISGNKTIDYDVIVVIKTENNVFKIAKCIDIYPE